ncbi:MAG TPA: aminotransferase class I/II-fold pyridoxal phosphate-dependent enzyme, partial [Candidatus Limnocylindrales bacterium]|nr:aminotransferase class I/II-fold pyridoxal phosphate-dependent enzyme [Candidatus Limnocylindrales bacterium]
MKASVESPVPLLDLGAVHGPLAGELVRDFERVLRSGQFILGPEHDAFEKELAAACGVEHAVGMASGTAALSIALLALGLGPGDEVIVPAFTYFASASAVTSIGGRPVFVDVEPERLGLDPALVEAAITPRTRAIMAVHLYGLSCDLEPLLAIGARRSIPVLEDAAQAIGATDRGRPVGLASAAATLSFFPTKNLGGLG